jgi:nitrous oxidase accessory protein NosD
VTSNDPTGTVQLLEDDITWDGFEIRDNTAGPGMYTSPQHSGYFVADTIFRDNGMGLHLGADGAHQVTVCRNRFIANNEFTGTGAGNGIFSNQGAKDVVIADNRFEHHNGAGILFADSKTGIHQRDIRVGWNQSVEDRTFAAFFATAQLVLKENIVRARLTDPDPQLRTPVSAIFIGARNDHVVVVRNRITSASGNGIDVTNTGGLNFTPEAPTDVDVLRNKVDHAKQFGIEVSASGLRQYEIRGNRAFTNGEVGIHLGPLTDDIVVTGNRAVDNPVDCKDESRGSGAGDGTAGTENSWQENLGNSASPGGICSPPTTPDTPGVHHNPPRKHKDPCRCTLPWRL